MNDTPNFSSILDQVSKDVKQLPPLPVGTYQARVAGPPTYEPVGAKLTPAVNFVLTGFVATQDVDREELAKCGDIQSKEMKLNMFTTEAAAWRLKQFLDHLGIEENDRTLRERLADAPSRLVLVSITHTFSKDPTKPGIFANINTTAKLQ
jgi:hypothetical protein